MEEINEELQQLIEILESWDIKVNLCYPKTGRKILVEYVFDYGDTTMHRLDSEEQLIDDMKDVFYEETRIKL